MEAWGRPAGTSTPSAPASYPGSPRLSGLPYPRPSPKAWLDSGNVDPLTPIHPPAPSPWCTPALNSRPAAVRADLANGTQAPLLRREQEQEEAAAAAVAGRQQAAAATTAMDHPLSLRGFLESCAEVGLTISAPDAAQQYRALEAAALGLHLAFAVSACVIDWGFTYTFGPDHGPGKCPLQAVLRRKCGSRSSTTGPWPGTHSGRADAICLRTRHLRVGMLGPAHWQGRRRTRQRRRVGWSGRRRQQWRRHTNRQWHGSGGWPQLGW
eukprot:SAG25_NODE_404_length_8466_cov_7.291502_1_plen_267_part_00